MKPSATLSAESARPAPRLPPGRTQRQLIALVLGLYVVIVLLGGWLIVRTLRALDHERLSMRENTALQAVSTTQGKLLLTQGQLRLFLAKPTAANQAALGTAEQALQGALDKLSTAVNALPAAAQTPMLLAQARALILARQQVLGSQTLLSGGASLAQTSATADAQRVDAIRIGLKTLREHILDNASKRRMQMQAALQWNAELLIAFGVLLMGALGLALRSMLRALGERRRLLARLDDEASLDALTRLPNRPYFLAWLEQARLQAQADGTALALLRVDVMPCDDAAFAAAAQRLAQAKRRIDVLARIGQRSLGLLAPLHRLDTLGRQDLAELALRMADALGQDGVTLSASPSKAAIGIALYPSDADDTPTLLDATRHAVEAARAQAGGGPRMAFVDDPGGLSLQRAARLRSALPMAIARGELRLLAQAEYAAADLRIVAAEALLRWEHPELGLLCPQEFLPLAQRAGLMPRITDWVLQQALDALVDWRRRQPQMRVAVNVTREDWLDPGFTARVAAALAARELPGQALELELSEEQLLGSDCAETLRQVHALGVRLALDDFGVAYSAFSHLQLHPVHRVKIDRSFVARLPQRGEDAQLLSAIVRFAHGLKLVVTCEGLETADQIALLRELGADELQGFGLSHPIAPQALSDLLAPTGPS